MNITEKMTNVADTIFRSILKTSADRSGVFRVMITIEHDQEEKPLMVVGNAHPTHEDGHCIAVLNPDESVQKEIRGGVAYGGGVKEYVQGKCDAMVELWIDAYKKDGTSVLSSYTTRSPKQPKFEVA